MQRNCFTDGVSADNQKSIHLRSAVVTCVHAINWRARIVEFLSPNPVARAEVGDPNQFSGSDPVRGPPHDTQYKDMQARRTNEYLSPDFTVQQRLLTLDQYTSSKHSRCDCDRTESDTEPRWCDGKRQGGHERDACSMHSSTRSHGNGSAIGARQNAIDILGLSLTRNHTALPT